MEKKPVILITGVCGRIGCAAAEAFAQQYQVVGLDICTPTTPCEGVDYLLTDISSIENVRDSFQKVKKKYGDRIASLIHLAAYYNFTGGAWEKYEKITIQGTRNLLEVLPEFQLEQFIFSSTMLVYAPCKLGEKITEESPLDPKWEYPLSKVKTEALIEEMQGKAKSVILRISGVYDDECHSIPISQQIMRIFEKKLESHFFPGNLEHGSAFLHMEDLIKAIRNIVEKRDSFSHKEIFVLGEPNVMSYQELQKQIGILLHGKEWSTMRIPKWGAKMGAFLQDSLPFIKKPFIKPWMVDLADDHYDLDISKAEKTLGWDPSHSLKNTLPKMVEAMKKDPKKWYEKHAL